MSHVGPQVAILNAQESQQIDSPQLPQQGKKETREPCRGLFIASDQKGHNLFQLTWSYLTVTGL